MKGYSTYKKNSDKKCTEFCFIKKRQKNIKSSFDSCRITTYECRRSLGSFTLNNYFKTNIRKLIVISMRLVGNRWTTQSKEKWNFKILMIIIFIYKSINKYIIMITFISYHRSHVYYKNNYIKLLYLILILFLNLNEY